MFCIDEIAEALVKIEGLYGLDFDDLRRLAVDRVFVPVHERITTTKGREMADSILYYC
jgi:hypothetical protein